MNVYSNKIRWKLLLFITAALIGVSSLWYTGRLVDRLKIEERKKMELWARANQEIIDLEDLDMNIDFFFRIIENNTTVPVIMVDEAGDTLSTLNLDHQKLRNPKYLQKQIEKMASGHDPLEIVLGETSRNYILYKDSLLLEQLKYFPYIQLAVIILFIFVAYLAFSNARKSEQNQVWVGLSKETAHQLGTPTSSLIGWLDVLKMRNINTEFTLELEKDIKRLEKITDRFSKIGSKPILSPTNIVPVIVNSVAYIKSRSSKNVIVDFNFSEKDQVMVPLNTPLFEWVIENLSKNAIDAIGGSGSVRIHLTHNTRNLTLDLIDSGRGIPKSKFKSVFKPGYTSKHRGWGLGLSLSRRIIELYHGGKIFVHQSELNKGTVMRIILNR